MEKDFKQLVRLVDADIDGNRPLYHALTKIKGVSYSFSNAICNTLKLDRKQKIGTLSDDQLKKIGQTIKNPKNFPSFILNRQKDYDTGENKHISSTDIRLIKGFDIKRLRKIKSYRGFRHGANLPVRGQRTKGHFRKGAALGVKRKKGKKGKV